MLGIRSASKDDFGFSPDEAVYSSPLVLPGEFLSHTEFPPEVFLGCVEQAVSRFSGPPCHHMKFFPPATASATSSTGH